MRHPTGSNGEPAQPLIRFDKVTKKYGTLTAIQDLSLDIYPGEFFALLGPSGCGKTTLMRMIAGFEDASAGSVLLNGQDMSGVPANRREVNMMFQSYALFPHMSVEKNIAFGLKQDGWDKKATRERVDEMLSLVQMETLAGRKPHQLSGGQRQRVALARSLAKKPKVLLLDEPLGALDRKLREETQFELVDLQERLGLTFVIVTHDQEEAMTVATRIAVMKGGQLLQVDEPARIYEHPANAFIADFVGNVNMFDITIADTSGELLSCSWDNGDTPMVIRPQPEDGYSVGDQAKMVLRPEKVHITKAQPDAAHNINMAPGEIEEISYTGATSTYLVRLNSGALMRVQEANRMLLDRRELTWGDKVWLHWRAGACVTVRD
ncbi:ABC transporter ATP-binding protein [uncultured Ruegeria sp.]|uniref:ABC transporter ATP-binding protein n=1 Tax=uncultured Ruegeria sp. TaxID=259304 RepID=UPI002623D37B|nr:ABC transporter ATP-binding protein [uncultured Ruegeria sp.]